MHYVTNWLKPTAVLAAASALFFVATMIAVAPQKAAATPAYAQQTGMACGGCHVSAAGGGKLTSTGAKFQANGHKMPGK